MEHNSLIKINKPISENAEYLCVKESLNIEFIKEINEITKDAFILVEKFQIAIKTNKENLKNITSASLEILLSSLDEHQSKMIRIGFGENAQNLINQRDRWINLSIEALILSNELYRRDLLDKAWLTLNVAARFLGKAEIVSHLEVLSKIQIKEKQRKKSSRQASGAIIEKEKDFLIYLFKKYAPKNGWKNMKAALHQIEPYLLEKIKEKIPDARQQDINSAYKDKIEKLTNWMRSDKLFKMNIERYIQCKKVPDLTEVDLFNPCLNEKMKTIRTK